MNLILGGTHGLGNDLAKKLQSNNLETYIVGRSYSKDDHGLGMKADLSDDTDVESIVEHIESIEHLTGFYWVTGYGYAGDFANQKNPLKMAEVNFANALPVVQAAWIKMLQLSTKSHFVVISSTSGLKPRDNEAVYVATKYAQVGLTRSLGKESERLDTNTKVALFMPGGMQTPFWGKDKPNNYESYLDSAKVARSIYSTVVKQEDYFYEETIERGSL